MRPQPLWIAGVEPHESASVPLRSTMGRLISAIERSQHFRHARARHRRLVEGGAIATNPGLFGQRSAARRRNRQSCTSSSTRGFCMKPQRIRGTTRLLISAFETIGQGEWRKIWSLRSLSTIGNAGCDFLISRSAFGCQARFCAPWRSFVNVACNASRRARTFYNKMAVCFRAPARAIATTVVLPSSFP